MNAAQIGLIWLHVSGDLVWIGSILSVSLILTSSTGEPAQRGEIGARVYKKLAVPAFLVAFVAGLARLLWDPRYYLSEHHWMHGKLLFALVAIGIHHVIGARAKKMAAGVVKDAGPSGMLGLIVAASAAIAAFFAVFKVPG